MKAVTSFPSAHQPITKIVWQHKASKLYLLNNIKKRNGLFFFLALKLTAKKIKKKACKKYKTFYMEKNEISALINRSFSRHFFITFPNIVADSSLNPHRL